MTSPQEMVETYGVLVEEAMHKWFLDHAYPIPAFPMTEYHLGWRNQALETSRASGGKMLRPVLALLSYQAFNSDIDKIVPLAAAIELYHNHTLVFDDMQDGDRFRRNRPTVWSLWGVGQGINVGLILGYLTLHFVLQLREKGFSHEKLFVLERNFTETMLEVAQGQSMDLDFETLFHVPASKYLDMIEKKTGSLISFSTFGGALLAQEDSATAEAFKTFGRKLGVAMQIRDDLVGVWGGKEQSGKETAKDLRRRKKTFPYFKALDVLSPGNLKLLRDHFAAQDEPDSRTVDQIVSVMERDGVREICEKEANALVEDLFKPLHARKIPARKLAPLETFSRYAFDSIGTLRQPVSAS